MPASDLLSCAAEIPHCSTLDVNPLHCAQCNTGYGYITDQSACNTCSDVTILDDAGCTECTSTVTPAYAVSCTKCSTGMELLSGKCTKICVIQDSKDSSKCEECISGYYVDLDGKCVKECPSDTEISSDKK